MTGLLIVGAHPDDAEYMAGAVASIEHERARKVEFLVITDGERWHVDPLMVDVAKVADLRRQEAREAAFSLGATPRFGGLLDGSLDDCPHLLSTLIGVIREVRPITIVTHSPTEGHPDHRATARAVLRACNVMSEPPPISNPRWFPELGSGHDIKNLYLAAQGHNLFSDDTIFVEATEASMTDKVQALLKYRSQYSDAEALEMRIRLTARFIGQIVGANYAEAFIPAPGYRGPRRYNLLP